MLGRRTTTIVAIVGLLLSLTVVPPGGSGPGSAPASAAPDTSSCEAMTGNDARSVLLRQACFSRIAKTDIDACDRAPDPQLCVTMTAAELESPDLIIENLEGLERDLALGVYVVTTYDRDAADLIESNLIHDVVQIGYVGVAYAGAQVEGLAVAPTKDYCTTNLKGNYDYYGDDLWKYGITTEEEETSNADLCNLVVAAIRQRAYGEDACDAWLPTVTINLYDSPTGVQEHVDRCNEMADDIAAKMSELGVTPVVRTEEQAWADLAAEMDAWSRGAARINPGKHETHFVGGQGCDESNPYWYWYCGRRYNGKTLDITPSPTSIVVADRHVDYGFEYHNVVFTAAFAEPPPILEEGEQIDLSATLSWSGSWTAPSGLSMTFQYGADGVALEGESAIGVNVSSGGGTITPSFTVPLSLAGGEFTISAGFWNCAACRVEWVYRSPHPDIFDVPQLSDSEEELVDDLVGEIDTRPPSEVNDVGKQARIVMLNGGVEILRDGESEWQPANEDLILRPGDYIRTGLEGVARLVISSQGAAAQDEAAVVNIPSETEVGMTPLFRPDQERRGFSISSTAPCG